MYVNGGINRLVLLINFEICHSVTLSLGVNLFYISISLLSILFSFFLIYLREKWSDRVTKSLK